MVYDLINKNQRFSKDFRLVSQIQAAAVSSMSNIAEGFARKGHKEFILDTRDNENILQKRCKYLRHV
jgi:four helix bundle protein